VVALKRLSDAVKDNNDILGVNVGSAANQAHNLSHISVSHLCLQAEFYQEVMDLSNVISDQVSCMGTHGTGTGVGDPVEVPNVCDTAGRSHRNPVLYFGSIRGNIGHTGPSAWVPGLVQILLVMQHRIIPRQARNSSLFQELHLSIKQR
jgi:acyl transferase domain-containing protein